MTGIFELVFAGLCLFVLEDGVDVSLLRTNDTTYARCEKEQILLHEHKPYLVIQEPVEGWEIQCSKTDAEQSCDFGDMDCTMRDLTPPATYYGSLSADSASSKRVPDVWQCPIQERDLCVRTDRVDPRIQVKDGRDGRENLPDNDDERKAFDWIAHLQRIDEEVELKDEVKRPVKGNRLIASRVHSEVGRLSTHRIGRHKRRSGVKDVLWSVAPNRQSGAPWEQDHPKALAEEISLTIDEVEKGESIRLEECVSEDPYWWEFKRTSSRSKTLHVRVENLAEDCDSDCTVNTDSYPNRLRHFLWYYELVEWKEDCPDHLSAPLCSRGNCERAQPYVLSNSGHLCPPSSYP